MLVGTEAGGKCHPVAVGRIWIGLHRSCRKLVFYLVVSPESNHLAPHVAEWLLCGIRLLLGSDAFKVYCRFLIATFGKSNLAVPRFSFTNFLTVQKIAKQLEYLAHADFIRQPSILLITFAAAKLT